MPDEGLEVCTCRRLGGWERYNDCRFTGWDRLLQKWRVWENKGNGSEDQTNFSGVGEWKIGKGNERKKMERCVYNAE